MSISFRQLKYLQHNVWVELFTKSVHHKLVIVLVVITSIDMAELRLEAQKIKLIHVNKLKIKCC